VDISALREQFETLASDAVSNDPAQLKERIAELQRQLSLKPSAERIEVPILPDAHIERLGAIADGLSATGKDLVSMGQEMLATANNITDSLRSHAPLPDVDISPRTPVAMQVEKPIPRTRQAAARKKQEPPSQAKLEARKSIHQARLNILDTLASFAAIGIPHITRDNVAVFAKLSVKSSATHNHITALKDAGLIAYPRPGMVSITTAGNDLAITDAVLPLSARYQQGRLSCAGRTVSHKRRSHGKP
jgi:hypothetical protein